MKIYRLLDPDQSGANGSTGSVAAPTTTAPVQTQVVETKPEPVVEKPTDPGTQAREAREARIAKEQADLWEEPKTEEKPEVKVVPQVNTTTTQPANNGISAQDAARIAAETLRLSQVQQPKPQPQLTQEEIDNQLGVVKVTPEMCTEMGLPAEAAPFLDAFAKKIVTNAVRMANVIVEQKTGEINRTIAPHISFAQHQQHIMLENQFREKFPELKGYEPIVSDVAAKLKASGFKGTQEQAFTKIRDESLKYLKGMGIDPATKTVEGGTAGAETSSTTSKPKMSTVSAGSQGGSGGAPKASKEESWAEIWEK